MITLDNLKNFAGTIKKRKRVGRGNASGHGTYSTRGMKGQKSRSGSYKGLKLKGLKQMLLRIPKNSGFKSIHPKHFIVNLKTIEKICKSGDLISPKTVRGLNLIPSYSSKKGGIKILGVGELTKAIKVEKCFISDSARVKIEKAGGEIIK
jgi:large subunit ribosomal protein L15